MWRLNHRLCCCLCNHYHCRHHHRWKDCVHPDCKEGNGKKHQGTKDSRTGSIVAIHGWNKHFSEVLDTLLNSLEYFSKTSVFFLILNQIWGRTFFSLHLYFSEFHGVFFWILESIFRIFHPKLDKMTFAIILTILIIITDSQSQDHCYLRSQSGSWTDLTSWFTRWPSTERTEWPASKSSRGLHKKKKKKICWEIQFFFFYRNKNVAVVSSIASFSSSRFLFFLMLLTPYCSL